MRKYMAFLYWSNKAKGSNRAMIKGIQIMNKKGGLLVLINLEKVPCFKFPTFRSLFFDSEEKSSSYVF